MYLPVPGPAAALSRCTMARRRRMLQAALAQRWRTLLRRVARLVGSRFPALSRFGRRGLAVCFVQARAPLRRRTGQTDTAHCALFRTDFEDGIAAEALDLAFVVVGVCLIEVDVMAAGQAIDFHLILRHLSLALSISAR